MADKTHLKESENEMDFMPLSEAAKLTGYTPEYLNLLSRKKKLMAKKIGRNWYTKKEWISNFLAVATDDAKTVETTENEVAVSHEPVQKSKEFFDAREKPTVVENYFTKSELLEMKERGVSFEKEEKKNLEPKMEEEVQLLELKKTSSGNWLKIFSVMSAAMIILPFIFAGMRITKIIFTNSRNNSELARVYVNNQNSETKIFNENSENGKVAGIETTQNENDTILASANFRINSINVGGNTLVLSNESNQSLQIENIKSDSFADNKKNETSLVVAWQTNKMAISELDYSKTGGQNPASLGENSYGFNHSAVISGLEPGASYVFQIKAKDRWANEMNSDFFGVYTASKPVSVFDLISNAVGEVFGWAIKK